MTDTSELISEYLAGGRIDIELEMDADREDYVVLHSHVMAEACVLTRNTLCQISSVTFCFA